MPSLLNPYRHGASASLPTPQEVTFDGTNDWLSSAGLTGAGSTQAVSAFIQIRTSALGARSVVQLPRIEIFMDVDERLRFILSTSGGTPICNVRTAAAINSNIERTIHFSYDGVAGAALLYLDGVASEEVFVETTGTATFTGAAAVGAFSGGSLPWLGQLRQVRLWNNVALNVANATVRANMADQVQAASLGDNIVDVYGTLANWNAGKNWGSGGDFTPNGAFT